jgi:hypothetical protein
VSGPIIVLAHCCMYTLSSVGVTLLALFCSYNLAAVGVICLTWLASSCVCEMTFRVGYLCVGAIVGVANTLGSFCAFGAGTLGSFGGTGWLFVWFLSGSCCLMWLLNTSAICLIASS